MVPEVILDMINCFQMANLMSMIGHGYRKKKKKVIEMEKKKTGRGWKGSLESYFLMKPNEVA